MVDISRRSIVKAARAIGITMPPVANGPTVALAEGHAKHPPLSPPPSRTYAKSAALTSQQRTTYLSFNNEEAAFIEAAVARLIPKDDQSN